MKAIEIREHHGIEHLTMVERPMPIPEAGQILLRVRAVSLNYRDLLVIRGCDRWRTPLPRIPTTDAAGEVAALGPGVTRVSVGDRVAAIFIPGWRDGELTADKLTARFGGTGGDGMLVEYAVLDAEGVVHIPPGLSFEEASTLPCAAVTAWHALIARGGTKPGDVVVVQGTGGVSLFSIRFAAMCGARVIVTSGSDQKLARVRDLGATDVINYRNAPNWPAVVLELTGGRGADHIIDLGGPATLNESIAAVRLGGTISDIGFLGGLSGTIDTVEIMRKSIRLQGLSTGSREMFEAMNRAIALHDMHPVIDRVFAFDDARHAFRHLDSGAHFGKVCIGVA